MATRYHFGDNEKPHFITFAVVNWIGVFTREVYVQILLDSLKFCIEKKGLKLHAWAIMSNHVHLIASAQEGLKLADIMRDMKKFTSQRIIAAIEENQQESRKDWLLWMFKRAGAKNKNNDTYQFWQQDNHPIELSTNQMMDERIGYLHTNPVKAGIVWEPQHYKYSSAIDYYTEENGL
ncbi:REP-associated tyrosine transposase [Mucilaginibacter sp. E4BP6]|uniref:REP-associated tyrosine transposase n=1 Tax=Mucilaginibacter sp. E4BP6 TaxID=2723089 RepID=UPI0015C87D75|nr:transposase [Mucilaginibacter sp. E4BP6]NYE65130.1 REP element-mobilizing transposase RayT [Mucilaginibacter sp. E4BP6]